MESSVREERKLRKMLRAPVAIVVSASILLTGMGTASASNSLVDKNQLSEAEISQDAYVSSAASGDAQPIALGEKIDGLHVPESASNPIRVDGMDGRSGVEIGIPGEGHGEQLPNGSILYDAESPQTKVVVDSVPITMGGRETTSVRQLITIGGPEADTRFKFPVDLPEGGILEKADNGTVTALDSKGVELGIFAPAWAVDADGQNVATHYEVSGNTLTQVVEHHGAAYPVTADPWWFVLVPIARGAAVRISVNAATKKAAQEAARKIAIKQGAKPTVSAPSLQAYKGSFITARGFTIKKGAPFSKKNSYASFDAFKKANGNAKKGYEWHHIIEQNMVRNTGGRIQNWVVQNKQNLVQIPRDIHRKCVTPIMGTLIKNIPKDQLKRMGLSTLSSKSQAMSLRNYMAAYYSDRNMHALGMELLSICGVKVG